MLRGLLLIALASIFWGTTGSITTVLVDRAAAHPFLIGTVRMWLAASLLTLGARLTGGPLALDRALSLRCLAMGACMAAFQAAYFTAVTLSGIAVTALLAICSAPLMIAALAVLFLGERLTPRMLASLGLGVAGTALLAAPGAGEPGRLLPAGAVLALTAGLAYALYAVLAKSALRRAAPLAVTALSFVAAAVLMLPLLVWTTAPLAQVTRAWPGLLYLGVVATAGSYALYSLGLRHVPASAAGIVTLLEPFTATLLGVLLFGERLGPHGVAGAALAISSIVLLLVAPAPAGITPGAPTGSAGRRPG